jgi:hypothetical protein
MNIMQNKGVLIILSFIIIVLISAFGHQINVYFDNHAKKDEFELIGKFLQPDNYHVNKKPTIWVHSRNELHIPYVQCCIDCIKKYNEEFFTIRVINDESFNQLIPFWKTDKNRRNVSFDRMYGMTLLLYLYGGIVVPHTFLCMKTLHFIYKDCIQSTIPFLFENNNKFDNKTSGPLHYLLYVPDITFIGSVKDNIIIKEMLHYMTNKPDYLFTGDIHYWCLKQQKEKKMILLDGSLIGVKDRQQKQITIDDWMINKEVMVVDGCLGIFIPHDQMEKRMQYRYFLSLDIQDILALSIALSAFFSKAINDIGSST